MNSKGKKFIAFYMILCLIVLSFPAVAYVQTNMATIKVGLTEPLSGASSAAGMQSLAAVELALEIINEKHPEINLPFAATEGIPNKNGAKIEMLISDSKGNAEDGMTEAEKLINQGIVMLTGGHFSGVTAAASQVAERYGIPYLNDCSSSPKLTQRGYKWFFSITPDDADFAEMFFKFFEDMKIQGKKIDNVGLIYYNGASGIDGAEAIKKFAGEYGYNISSDLMYDVKTTNLTGEIQKLKMIKPDVLIPISYVTDSVLLMKTMKDMSYVPQAIIAQDAGFVEKDFLPMLGLDGEYILSREMFSPELAVTNPNIKKISDMFYEKNGYYLNGNGARTVQVMFVIADVLNRAKSLSPEDIRVALTETDFKADQMFMPWEGVKFNEKGKNILGRGFLTQIQNGKYMPVWPKDIATATLIWPFPAWDQRK
jgi:branched-chain amino acid transport system substrate-binding protein